MLDVSLPTSPVARVTDGPFSAETLSFHLCHLRLVSVCEIERRWRARLPMTDYGGTDKQRVVCVWSGDGVVKSITLCTTPILRSKLQLGLMLTHKAGQCLWGPVCDSQWRYFLFLSIFSILALCMKALWYRTNSSLLNSAWRLPSLLKVDLVLFQPPLASFPL